MSLLIDALTKAFECGSFTCELHRFLVHTADGNRLSTQKGGDICSLILNRIPLDSSHASCIRFLVHTADGRRLSMSTQKRCAFSSECWSHRGRVLHRRLLARCWLPAPAVCLVCTRVDHAARVMHIHESSVNGPAAAGRKTLKRSIQLQWCIWCARCQTAQLTSDAPGADGVLFTSAQGDV